MSKFNSYAETPEALEVTQQWVKRKSPLLFVYGKSGVGKTKLIGSLFRLEMYRPVLIIDADQGTATIDEYTLDPSLCELRMFDRTPDRRIGWMNEQIAYARTATCGAIVIEGLTSIHSGMVSSNMESISDPEGTAAMRAHIGPTNRTGALIESLRSIKQHRLATGKGVPIIVTLNTRETPVSPGQIDSARKTVPDWSPNLTDKAKRAGDAFIELVRPPSGLQMLTLPTPDNDARKLRAPVSDNKSLPNAAAIAQKQLNLDLPGLLSLWAKATHDVRAAIRAEMKSKAEAKPASAD